jgi:hypothetical protein
MKIAAANPKLFIDSTLAPLSELSIPEDMDRFRAAKSVRTRGSVRDLTSRNDAMAAASPYPTRTKGFGNNTFGVWGLGIIHPLAWIEIRWHGSKSAGMDRNPQAAGRIGDGRRCFLVARRPDDARKP